MSRNATPTDPLAGCSDKTRAFYAFVLAHPGCWRGDAARFVGAKDSGWVGSTTQVLVRRGLVRIEEREQDAWMSGGRSTAPSYKLKYLWPLEKQAAKPEISTPEMEKE